MALAYNTSTGYTQATTSSLTPKLWDKLLHEQVQNKLVFRSLVGKDKGKEGSLDEQVSNFPIVEKTQLNKEAGDRITMGLVRALGTTDGTIGSSNYQLVVNRGFTANEQMVDNESSLTFYYLNTLISNYRDAVLIQGKITVKRSPYDLLMTAKDRLSDALAKYLDDDTIFTLYAGYSSNVIRELGVATAVPTAHPNTIFGKDKSAYANMDATDVVDTDFIERIKVAIKVNNLNPVKGTDGKDSHLLLVHPYGMRTLRGDSLWVTANGYGMPRGKENPIFSGAEGEWGGVYVQSVNQVEIPYDYANASVTGSGTGASPHVVSVSAQTPPAGGTNGNFRMNILLGANSVGRAFGLESYMERRKEDDYGNLMGFGGGFIFGQRRADWTLDGSSTVKNQSSLVAFSYSPNPNSNLSQIWT